MVGLLAPGFTELQVVQGTAAVGWVIWLVPLTVFSGVITAFHHAQNRFAIPAVGTFIVNCSIITGLLLVYTGYGSLRLVAIFVLIGGLMRLFSQLLQVHPVWNPVAGLFPWRLNKPLLIRYGQAMFSGSMLLLFPVVARALASYGDEGSVALFNYATRLVDFPLAIAVTFLTVVFFPRISNSFSNDPGQHRRLISYGVQITLGLSLVAAATLISLSDEYAKVVYSHGDMPNTSVILVASLTAVGLSALPLQGFSIFLTAVFNARKDTRTPLLLNGTGLIFFLLVSKKEIFGEGLVALMWGMVASYGLICVLQLMFLKIEKLNWRFVLLDKAFCSGVVCAVFISTCSSLWIATTDLAAWLSLLIACFFASLSLVVMALFNKELRSGLKLRLSNK